MRIGITGASSSIGKATMQYFASRGIESVQMGRNPGQRPFQLGDPVEPSSVKDLSGVVHLAWDRSCGLKGSTKADRNVVGSEHLLSACRRAGVPAVFLSTTSANFPQFSLYGASKLKVERIALGLGVRTFRAGIIWGGDIPPILNSLSAISNFPFLMPRVVPEIGMDHNHESYVCSRLLTALESGFGYETNTVSTSQERFKLSSAMSAFRKRRAPVVINIPAGPMARAARLLRDSTSFQTSRLDSLALLGSTIPLSQYDPNYPRDLGEQALLNWLESTSVVGKF